MSKEPEQPEPSRGRRALLRGAVLLASGLATGPLAAKKTDARKLPAQAGDELCFPSWEHDGRMLLAGEIEIGATPLLVYPRDPATGVVRERSRLNQILVMRFAPEDLTESMRPLSADGVLAYSGLCTHTACGVSEWKSDEKHLLCPCHGSEFDPLQKGKRITGPAPRSLPGLPIASRGEHLVIAGPFTSKVGANA